MDEPRATIYYDDDCGFCRRMTRIVLHIDNRRGRRLSPKALQHPGATADLQPLPRERQMESWHLRSAEGEVFSGGLAFAELARIWQMNSSVVRMIEANERFLCATYDWVARNRVGFGRLTRWIPDLSFRAKENPPA